MTTLQLSTTTTSIDGENDIETPIITKKRFSTMVEEKVQEYNVPYIEAVLMVCSDRELPPEDVKRLLSPSIISKIEAEALAVNAIKGGGAQLPI